MRMRGASSRRRPTRAGSGELLPTGRDAATEVVRWVAWDHAHLAPPIGKLVTYADVAGVPLADFAAVRRWAARLDELPAWRETAPPMPGHRP